MADTKIRTGGQLFIVALLIPFGLAFSPQQNGHVVNDTTRHGETFGMRLRALKSGAVISAPTMIQEAPGNEATMVRAQDEDLKIFFINRPGQADKMMSVSSASNGHSWSAPQMEFPLPGEAYYANQVLLGADKELHCVFHIFGTGENGYRNRHLNMWYCKTENNQQRWTKPVEIYSGYVGSIRGFIQLKNGRLLMAFARAVPSREQKPTSGIDYGWNEVICMYSDDNGKTWHQSDEGLNIAIDGTMPTRYGAVEPCITELQDGRTWMLIRTTKGYLYESYSDDSGTSWTTPEPTEFISSDSPATFLRLSDSRLLLLWSANQSWDDPRGYAMGGRQMLHGAISRDDGKTWRGFREVLSAPVKGTTARGDRGTAYPSAAETADGNVAFVSGQGEEKAIVVFDPDWLEQSSASDDFSEGLVQWTLYGGDTLTKLASLRKGNALNFRKSINRNHSDTEAVWNFPMMAKGEITADIELNGDSKGVSLALADHFSIAGDTLASKNAVIHFIIDEQIKETIRLKKNRLSVGIAWDAEKKKGWMSINGKRVAEKDFSRNPRFGLNYLRVGIPGKGEDLAGFLLHSVKVHSKM